jgi:cytoskeleton protein RodZ
MSDSTDNQASQQDEAGPTGGERLRKARRANDISVRDIAKELHLDEHKVRALEKNEFDVLGAPVFAKGHLRKYAELVGVDVDDIMTDYYQMNRATGAPPVVGPKRKIPREINPTPWIVAALAVIVVGGVTWWWLSTDSAEPAATIEPAVPAPFAADNEPEPEPEAEAEPEPEPEVDMPADPAAATTVPVAGSDEAEDDAAAEETGTSPDAAAVESAGESYAPTPGAPQVTVTLEFSGDCWTEVTDQGGRRLYYSLGQAGRSVNVSGDAPLRLIIGDADNVTLTVEGQSWPIPASARRGQLARLTIPAQ